jgi:hypothetical protein
MKVGTVISIPIENNFVLAKVIWLSEMIEKGMGFVIYPELYKASEAPIIKEHPYKDISIYSGVIKVLYSTTDNVENGNWVEVGELPLNRQDEELIIHNIGGVLYQGDRKLEKQEDINQYPKLLNAGIKAVENMIKAAFNIK